MLEDFVFYFREGLNHILDSGAIDHQLFIIALAIIYLWKDWRQVLVLVTAFTIGHSLTLALSVLDIIRFDSRWVEFLIPITIIITAVVNLFHRDFSNRGLRINYFLALFFGLIHGMGFANTIRMMLATDQSLLTGLFAFNVGLEVGQIAVVFVILSLSWLMVNKLKLARRYWINIISGIILLMSLQMALTRIPGYN